MTQEIQVEQHLHKYLYIDVQRSTDQNTQRRAKGNVEPVIGGKFQKTEWITEDLLNKLGVVAHLFNPSILEVEQMDLFEMETSMDYRDRPK